MRSSNVCMLFTTCIAVVHPSFGAEIPKEREELFPLTQVRLTGGPLQVQQEQNRKYLLRLEPDRLLSRFRSEAGLEPKAKPYGRLKIIKSPLSPIVARNHVLSPLKGEIKHEFAHKIVWAVASCAVAGIMV